MKCSLIRLFKCTLQLSGKSRHHGLCDLTAAARTPSTSPADCTSVYSRFRPSPCGAFVARHLTSGCDYTLRYANMTKGARARVFNTPTTSGQQHDVITRKVSTRAAPKDLAGDAEGVISLEEACTAPSAVSDTKKKAATRSPRGKAAAAKAAQPEQWEEDEAQEEELLFKKQPAKRSRAKTAKKPAKGQEDEEYVPGSAGEVEGEDKEQQEEAAPAPKRSRKKKEEVPRVVYAEAMRPPPPSEPAFKILSWNVAGLRAVIKKDPDVFKKLLQRESPDVVCLQETKISDKHIEELLGPLGLPSGWHASWSCSQEKAGYSGVATFSRVQPLGTTVGMEMPEHDGEGRLLVTEFPNCYVLNVYVPNSGEGLKRLDYRVKAGGWDDSLASLCKKLQQKKPVIITGDLNCAHQEIDIHNPKTNLRSAGFTQEERDSFGSKYLSPADAGGCDLVDTYRNQYPDIVGYTYYSHRFNCRAKGIGWRLDYFLASRSMLPRIHDSWMLPDVLGSDHIPLGITVLGSLDK